MNSTINVERRNSKRFRMFYSRMEGMPRMIRCTVIRWQSAWGRPPPPAPDIKCDVKYFLKIFKKIQIVISKNFKLILRKEKKI